MEEMVGEFWDRLRDQFWITRQGAYLMNAAVGGVHERVHQAVVDWHRDFTCFGAIHDEMNFEMISGARKVCSKLLGVVSEDLAFTPNTSFNMNLLALALKNASGKRQIILPEDEFPSSVLPWFHHGFEVVQVRSHQGRIHIEDILRVVHGNTAAVVTSAVQFLTGFRMPLVELGQSLKERGVPLIVNGTQQLGAFEIPFERAGISALSASGHKWFCAGMGQALFVTSKEFREKISWPLVGWTSVEDCWSLKNEPPRIRKETSSQEIGTLPFANIVALKGAAELISEVGLEKISKQILSLSNELEGRLREAGAEIVSCRDSEDTNSGIVTFGLKKIRDGNEFVKKLAQQKVYINARRGYFRASIHYYNNSEDIDHLIRNISSPCD